jgi:hypothetical protein
VNRSEFGHPTVEPSLDAVPETLKFHKLAGATGLVKQSCEAETNLKLPTDSKELESQSSACD